MQKVNIQHINNIL